MFYTNIRLELKKKEEDWGILNQYEAGESGRGRQLLRIPTYPDAEDIEAGLHKDLTIGFTRSGRPRLNKEEDSQMYMLLSAQGRYTRRGNGTIWCLKGKEDCIEVLSSGNGADGDAGRIGFWDVQLLEVPEETIIRVRTGGAGYGTPSDFYIVHGGNVYKTTVDLLEEVYEKIGVEIPCKTEVREGKIQFIPEEWRRI